MSEQQVCLVGGPLDGEVLPVEVEEDDPCPGVALPAPGCAFPGGRSLYGPAPDSTWRWQGDLP